MHTYITSGEVYIVGFLMTQKTNGTESFIPLFDVGSLMEAASAVSRLNGGEPWKQINVTREYTEGISPNIKIPIGISADIPAEEPDTP